IPPKSVRFNLKQTFVVKNFRAGAAASQIAAAQPTEGPLIRAIQRQILPTRPTDLSVKIRRERESRNAAIQPAKQTGSRPFGGAIHDRLAVEFHRAVDVHCSSAIDACVLREQLESARSGKGAAVQERKHN